MEQVAGKVAFVTGGASGIGLAMVRAFTGAGMRVAVADIEQAALDRVADEFAESNAEVITLQVDVNQRDALEAAADETERAFGAVHVLCNNAGVVVAGSVETMTWKDWDWLMNVNVHGVVNGVQVFLPRLLAHGDGHIVNTASMAGQFAPPNMSVYNTTKYAVVGLSETMRADLAEQGIGVSVLCPGVVRTNIGASGRNRPEALRLPDHTDELVMGDAAPSDAERAAALQRIFADALDPQVVGDMVLQAVLASDPYIFPHPDTQSAFDGRVAEIHASFERWRKWRAEQG